MSITSRKCVICGLTRAVDTSVTYHRFPNPGRSTIKKAQAWAKFCWPDQDWSSVESLKALHFGSKILCGRHFLSSQFIDEDRQKLCKHAVPSVLDKEYYKTCKPQEARQDSEVRVEEEDFNTEPEYLSDWETFEDVTYLEVDSIAEEPANVKNEPDSINMTPKSINRHESHVKTPDTHKTNIVKIEPHSVNIDIVKKEPSSVKKEPSSVKKEPYYTESNFKKELSLIKNVKKESYNERNVIQDMNKNPVLNDIVCRALSKSGITVKRIHSNNIAEIKPKNLDVKKSEVVTRKKVEVTKVGSTFKNALKEKQISNASVNKEGLNGSLKNEMVLTYDDDDVEHDFRYDDSDEDYDPNNETELDSDGEPKEDIDFKRATVKKENQIKTELKEKVFGSCRCCLKQGQHSETDVAHVLSCLNIHPSTDPDLSTLVCSECAQFLQRVTEFRNMVATSEVELASRAQLDVYAQSMDEMEVDDQENETADGDYSETERDGQSEQDEDYMEDVKHKRLLKAARYRMQTSTTGTTNKSRLKTLRENVVTIIMNSTILPFTFNKDPLLINHYECIHYDARFTEFYQLREHMEKKHPTPNEKYITNFVSQLQKGILRADVSNLKCRRCDLQVSNLDDLVEHLVNEHGIKYDNLNWDPPHNILGFDLSSEELKCPVCVKNFTTFRGLLAHMNQHYGSFLCPLCGMKFLYPDSFSKHKRSHRKVLPIKSVICDKCGINVTSRKALDLHKRKCNKVEGRLRKVKPIKKPKKIYISVDNFNCKLCHEMFEDASELCAHRIDHLFQSREKVHVCEICGYAVSKKSLMMRHFKRHYGIKDVFCNVCNKGFISHQDLKLHSQVHVARFQCPFCSDVCFLSKKDCTYHIKTEHVEMLPKKF